MKNKVVKTKSIQELKPTRTIFFTLRIRNLNVPSEHPIYPSRILYKTKEEAIEAAFEYAKEKESKNVRFEGKDNLLIGLGYDRVRYDSWFGNFDCVIEVIEFYLKEK